MNLSHASKKTSRRGTVDALAVVPAVLVLSAELFTPGSGKVEREGGGKGQEDGKGMGKGDGHGGGGARKDSGVGRWEDGIR